MHTSTNDLPLQEKTQSGAKKKKCIYRRCLVMFNMQPHVPGTKPLALQAEEGPKKDEGKDNRGHDTSSASSASATVSSVGAGDETQVDDETEKSVEIAAKVQTDMDVSHHEDRCFACKDGGGEFCFCWVFSRLFALALYFLHHTL